MRPGRSQLQHVLEPVSQGLVRMREVLRHQLSESSGAVRDMTDHVGRFQGKQLRAALVLLVGEATGNTTDEHPTVAAIVEMIHLATLVHDDILDGAEVRRRVACVNQRWDNQVAVLLGDFLYARAFALSTELSSRLCSRLLAATTRDICVAVGWSGDVLQARDRAAEADNGVEVAYHAPKEGAQMWFDQMAIPVDAPNPEGAHVFLNFIMDPENMAAASNYVYYANGNKASQEYLVEDVIGDPAIYPDEATLENLFTTRPYDAKVQRVVTRLWTKIKSGT